jgi:hypothetical protein
MKMFEKEFILQPLISGRRMVNFPDKGLGDPYYEQVLMYDGEWPFAIVHIDTFWPGQRSRNPIELYAIHDALNEGRTVKVNVKFTIIDEGDD